MVRGKAQPPVLKTHTTKRSNVKSTAAVSPAQITQKSVKAQEFPSCCNCGFSITEDTKALQCDRCASNDAWKCADCLHLTGDMYDHLVSDNCVTLRWFCDHCEKTVMSKTSSHSNSQSDKLDHLIGVIEKLVDRYENIEKSLETKCDRSEVTQLDMRVKHLEDKLSMFDNQFETRLSLIEQQRTPMPMSAMDKDNIVSDEDMIKFVVQEEINKKTEEERDLENRRKNVVIYRVPEKKTESVVDRKTSDMVFVKDLLDGVFSMKVDDQDIEKLYRLGRFEEDKTRPLLVAFRNIEQKDQIMENLRNLRQPIEKFRGIGVSHDLHPKERDERKRLVEEAKQQHIASDTDAVENYRFLVVGMGQRKKVLKIKKKDSAA